MDDLIDKVLGGVYHLDRFIGKGGHARVYHATHRDDSKSQYAVKVLDSQFVEDSDMLGRFRREIQILDLLKGDPNIVHQSYHEISETPPLAFFVMDFCGHGTLRQLFDKTFPEGWENGTLGLPLQLGECLCFIHQVADALDFAFRVYRTIHGEAKPAHIVHRDVKPSNILIDERDGRLCARLSDFGIAYLDDDAVRTRARGLMGSPLYAAREQFFYPHNVGPAADQYALAVIVYQLLTGAVPFPERARPLAISSPETLRRTPVSLRNLAPDAGISLAVEEVVLKALNWYPEQRYSSVHDFVRALDQAHNDLGDDIASRFQKPTIMIRDESNIHNLPTVANELERSDGESVTIAWWDKARTDWERVKAKGLGPWDRALVGAAAAPLMGLLSMPFTYGLTFPFGHYWLSVVLAIATLFGVPWWLKWRF